ncbi:hypothetical protein A2W24_06200 [Microgenomates group bacterium RBG_16_45_19]|nr:MAG: hypothetical protein A2W24_06200 [Microgenomates group bacterium RBG_16_45_19]
MTGIIGGDFITKDVVTAYYPHIHEGKLTGKTEFTMTLDDAALLMRRAASELKIDPSLLKKAVDGYLTEISFAIPEDWKLHEKDVAMSLAAKL